MSMQNLDKYKTMRTYEFIGLDKILLKLCYNIQLDNPTGGLVAAAIIDPFGNKIFGISRNNGKKWIHAEREVIDKYTAKYGFIPDGCIIITTLSPCNDKMDDRYGESCTDLLNNINPELVYCGYIDPTQNIDKIKFKLKQTNDVELIKSCQKIANRFLE